MDKQSESMETEPCDQGKKRVGRPRKPKEEKKEKDESTNTSKSAPRRRKAEEDMSPKRTKALKTSESGEIQIAQPPKTSAGTQPANNAPPIPTNSTRINEESKIVEGNAPQNSTQPIEENKTPSDNAPQHAQQAPLQPVEENKSQIESTQQSSLRPTEQNKRIEANNQQVPQIQPPQDAVSSQIPTPRFGQTNLSSFCQTRPDQTLSERQISDIISKTLQDRLPKEDLLSKFNALEKRNNELEKKLENLEKNCFTESKVQEIIKAAEGRILKELQSKLKGQEENRMINESNPIPQIERRISRIEDSLHSIENNVADYRNEQQECVRGVANSHVQTEKIVLGFDEAYTKKMKDTVLEWEALLTKCNENTFSRENERWTQICSLDGRLKVLEGKERQDEYIPRQLGSLSDSIESLKEFRKTLNEENQKRDQNMRTLSCQLSSFMQTNPIYSVDDDRKSSKLMENRAYQEQMEMIQKKVDEIKGDITKLKEESQTLQRKCSTLLREDQEGLNRVKNECAENLKQEIAQLDQKLIDRTTVQGLFCSDNDLGSMNTIVGELVKRMERIDDQVASILPIAFESKTSTRPGMNADQLESEPQSQSKMITEPQLQKAPDKSSKEITRPQDSWNKHIQEFNQQLRGKGLFLKRIEKDGNCLFRAISLSLEGTQENHSRYRKIACDYMENNLTQFYPELSEDESKKKETIRKMRQSGEYGDDNELSAICCALSIRAMVYKLNQKDGPIKIVPPGFISTILIAHHNPDGFDPHYSSVIEWKPKRHQKRFQEPNSNMHQDICDVNKTKKWTSQFNPKRKWNNDNRSPKQNQVGNYSRSQNQLNYARNNWQPPYHQNYTPLWKPRFPKTKTIPQNQWKHWMEKPNKINNAYNRPRKFWKSQEGMEVEPFHKERRFQRNHLNR